MWQLSLTFLSSMTPKIQIKSHTVFQEKIRWSNTASKSMRKLTTVKSIISRLYKVLSSITNRKVANALSSKLSTQVANSLKKMRR